MCIAKLKWPVNIESTLIKVLNFYYKQIVANKFLVYFQVDQKVKHTTNIPQRTHDFGLFAKNKEFMWYFFWSF